MAYFSNLEKIEHFSTTRYKKEYNFLFDLVQFSKLQSFEMKSSDANVNVSICSELRELIY